MFECKFCNKEFKSEMIFMNHRCSSMVRHEQLLSADGQGAYYYYSIWMKAFNRKVPSIEAFGTSRYFNSFLKYMEFIKRVNLAHPEKFVQLMVDKDISPMLWQRPECYSMYLEWNDYKSTPIEQADTTTDTLFKISDAANLAIGDVFEFLHTREIIQLIKERKLSPWILLCSGKFKEKLNNVSKEDYDELINLINPGYWSTKMQKDKESLELMKQIVKEIGI